jgi:hypothetical protein
VENLDNLHKCLSENDKRNLGVEIRDTLSRVQGVGYNATLLTIGYIRALEDSELDNGLRWFFYNRQRFTLENLVRGRKCALGMVSYGDSPFNFFHYKDINVLHELRKCHR